MPKPTNFAALIKLRDRSAEIVEMIDAVMPSPVEIAERICDIAVLAEPWSADHERRTLTSVAARLHAASTALLGLIGENDLALADSDELAASLADRGVFLPRKRGIFRRGR